MNDFSSIDSLKGGSERQQDIYRILVSSNLLNLLHPYDPLLVGSIPLDLNLPQSDVDIICCYSNKEEFIEHLKLFFSSKAEFKITESIIYGNVSVIADFFLENLKFEVFGQQIPTKLQMGYQHLLIESQLLQTHGLIFKEEICRLKEQGYKTEEAFCKLLGITGNPYINLIDRYQSLLNLNKT